MSPTLAAWLSGSLLSSPSLFHSCRQIWQRDLTVKHRILFILLKTNLVKSAAPRFWARI
jgi:hypothetical protein